MKFWVKVHNEIVRNYVEMDINKIENANKAQLVDLLTTLEDSNQSGKELENVAAKYFHKNLHQPDKQELFQHIILVTVMFVTSLCW